MITIIQTCPSCGSEELVSNGYDVRNGKQKYHCKNCGKYGTLQAAPRYSEERKGEIVSAYFERPSLRGISRIFGVSRPTLTKWLKAEGDKHPDLEATLTAVPTEQDVLEYDELQHFVKKKARSAGSGR